MKATTAAPPDVLRVDEKDLAASIPCSIVAASLSRGTTRPMAFICRPMTAVISSMVRSHKGRSRTGLLDRPVGMVGRDGFANVAAYLNKLDLVVRPEGATAKDPGILRISEHKPLAGGRGTSGRARRNGEPRRHNPDRKSRRSGRRNSSVVPRSQKPPRHSAPPRKCGYVPVRNGDAEDGFWKIRGARQVVAGRAPPGSATASVPPASSQKIGEITVVTEKPL